MAESNLNLMNQLIEGWKNIGQPNFLESGYDDYSLSEDARAKKHADSLPKGMSYEEVSKLPAKVQTHYRSRY